MTVWIASGEVMADFLRIQWKSLNTHNNLDFKEYFIRFEHNRHIYDTRTMLWFINLWDSIQINRHIQSCYISEWFIVRFNRLWTRPDFIETTETFLYITSFYLNSIREQTSINFSGESQTKYLTIQKHYQLQIF